MKISRFVCLVAVLCSGCAWARFRPSEGAQQNWPTAPGANVERSHGIPVYFGPQPRRYKVIGMIDATTAPVRRNGVVAFAARRAREIGGDAIIVRSEGHEFAGTFNTATAVMKWQALTGEIMEPAAKLLPICCQLLPIKPAFPRLFAFP